MEREAAEREAAQQRAAAEAAERAAIEKARAEQAANAITQVATDALQRRETETIPEVEEGLLSKAVQGVDDAADEKRRQLREEQRRMAREKHIAAAVEQQNEGAMAVTVGSKSRMIYTNCVDARQGIGNLLGSESVALTFTSPPYFNYIDYAWDEGVGKEKEYADYLASLDVVWRSVFEQTMPGGKLVLNISNMKSRKDVEAETFIYPLVADSISRLTRMGWLFFDEIVWAKMGARGDAEGNVLWGSYPYPPTPKIMDSTFENILVFRKEGSREQVSWERKQKSILTKEEWADFTMGVWNITTDHDPHHPATFPMALAERVIRLYSFVDDLVLDPFAGSGTAVIAAEKWGRAGVGYEIARTYETALRKKMEQWL